MKTSSKIAILGLAAAAVLLAAACKGNAGKTGPAAQSGAEQARSETS